MITTVLKRYPRQSWGNPQHSPDISERIFYRVYWKRERAKQGRAHTAAVKGRGPATERIIDAEIKGTV